MRRFPLVVLFCLVHFFHFTFQIDSSSFLVYNVDHNKCVVALNANSIQAGACNPSNDAQLFRWTSGSRLLSISQKLCLGAQSLKDWVKVLLYPCDEKSNLQQWECKNETLFGLVGADLHFNYGNFNEKNMMIYKGSGSWSRWQIYGTQENLCSRGYEEIFSIGGNGLGSPCQFPFRFDQKWYAECTLAGRSDGLLWCSMDTDYDKGKKWGFCPTKSNNGWDSDPVTGVLYQRNTQATLTWHQARKSCQQQDADLLSVVELHEQTYIAGLTNTLGSSLWIGLNSLDFDSGWQWSNGNPFRYLNWAPGHPSSVPGMNCAALNSGKASKWESISCSQKLGYICRKGNSTSLTPLPSVMDQPGFCPSHWVPYAGRCYYIQRTKKMWKDALAECHKEGGDLASLHNIEEQSFVISQLGYLESDELWIGLNDQRTPMLFEWSDRSHVTFTNWKVGEPSHGVSRQEDCVLIKGKDGKWADHLCEKEFGYICKKKASTKQTGTSVTVAEGCKPGWTRFGAYCYYVSSEKKTFDEAKDMCQSSYSYLIDVINRYENAYLVSLVGLRPEKYFWIGLSNTADRHTFVWTNTKNVKFTHFNVGMPDRNQGCVAMTTGMLAGLWDVISCSTQQKYICKHLAEGIISTVAPPTTPPLTCPLQWRSLGTRNYCYKSLNGRNFLSALKVYHRNTKQKKTWFESRDFCRAIGGDLLSIHSSSDFDGNIMGSVSENAWIGINALNANSGFTWSDGSVVSYENWGYGEPNNYNDVELCGEVSFYYGKPWNDRHCEVYSNWICQIRKGVTPKPEPTNTIPEYNVTKDGWIQYNNTQYYINKQKLAVDDARAYCKRNFGDLVVITGETERKFLWKQISRENEDQYYIGLTVDLDKTFQWVDGSPVSYVAWENNEPNFANNDENCVTMYKSMGFWNDINCGVTLPSICKRNMDVPVNTTSAPTEAPKGGCPPDWNFFQGKCYKFLGESQSEPKSWRDARSYCINLGGNLVSILNEKEQAYLTITRAAISSDAWIGLNDINWEMRFLWTDGRGVYYTNWAKGQPISVPEGGYTFMDDDEYDCVVLVGGSSLLAGLWKVERCAEKRGFICKRNIDPQINIPATTAFPKTYQKLGNDSYKVVAQEMNWDESRRQCKADDADLASILDSIAQAYVSMFLYRYKKSMWIGLNTNETNGYFHWTDNWRMRYSNWAPGEPRNNIGCVFVDVDGKWKTASCSESHYSLCKHSPEVAPTDAPQLPGICPEPKRRRTWVPFRGHCYAFMLTKDLWAQASIDCMRMGGTLLSIEDPVEAKFITDNLDILQDGSKSFWIGLYKTHRGDWLWLDNSVVDYSNWLFGEPSATNEECVEILSDTGKWNNNNCNRYKSYICKMPKVIPPTQKPQTVVQPEEPPQSFAGVAIAVVIVILTLVGVAGYFLYKRRPVLQECTFDNTLYFNSDSSRSTSIDTKGLVDNIEQNERAVTI